MRGRQGILTIVIAVYLTISVTAATPYQNYTYDKSQETQAEPQAYVPVQAVSGVIAGTIDFSEPQVFLLPKIPTSILLIPAIIELLF